ncbi:MAG: hypothetical protein ACHQLA_06635 [Ignavibacteriales bacterium]
MEKGKELNMQELKPLSKEGINSALEKAERYRLLNEPRLAESICLDVLEVEPENHNAIITLILSITDQFGTGSHINEKKVQELLPLLKDEYERTYYAGLINERRGKAVLEKEIPGGSFIAYDWIISAMELYEKAEKIRPAGNDDAILRWNTCVRLIKRYKLEPKVEDPTGYFLE